MSRSCLCCGSTLEAAAPTLMCTLTTANQSICLSSVMQINESRFFNYRFTCCQSADKKTENVNKTNSLEAVMKLCVEGKDRQLNVLAPRDTHTMSRCY